MSYHLTVLGAAAQQAVQTLIIKGCCWFFDWLRGCLK